MFYDCAHVPLSLGDITRSLLPRVLSILVLCYTLQMSERHMTRQAVFMVLRNDKNEILLQQRSGTGYLDGYWDLPSGHVEYGESLLHSVVRETKEEVGVEVAPEDSRLIHIDQFYVDQDYTNYTFEATRWNGEPKICEPEKCSAIGWFAIEALPEKCVNTVRVNEKTGFSSELTYSVTDASNYATLIGA
jgi:8-oxo-dGTP diphosphatase